jgi:hypothetical protein
MAMKAMIPGVFAVALMGCAGVSDVVPAGNGTYMVAAHGTIGLSSGSAQKARAYEEASDFCQGKHLTFQPIDTTENEGDGLNKAASAEVEFRCVSAGTIK